MRKGRFKCQALLDDAAVVACMAYVDLNPIRAGMASNLAGSDHTSIKHRLATTQAADVDAPLQPVAGSPHGASMPLANLAYLSLVDWTGRIVRPDKRGAIAANVPPAIANLGLDVRQWQSQVMGIETHYWRAVGAVDALIEKASAMGQCWLKGQGVAGRVVRTVRARGRG